MRQPFDAHYELRDGLYAALRSDLVGPLGGPDEVLVTDAPVTAYPVGVLFPQTHLPWSSEDAEGAPDLVRGDPDEEPADAGVVLANRRKPSSIGLTFSVDTSVTRVLYVKVRAAAYVPQDQQGVAIEAHRSDARSTEQQREQWRRKPIECGPVRVELDGDVGQRFQVWEGLELRTLIRTADPSGVLTATVTLINTFQTQEFDLQDAFCFFQCELVIYGDEGTRPFVERMRGAGSIDDETALSMLLYRHAPRFGTGHGCSVAYDWSPPPIQASLATRAAVASIRTEFVPTYEVLLTDSNAAIDGPALDMSWLGKSERGQVVQAFNSFLSGYEDWIRAREKEIEEPVEEQFVRIARVQIELCLEALNRMRRGVAILADPDRSAVFEAFQLANQAMAIQHARAKWIEGKREGKPDPDQVRWRPFQIGFFLQCLEGLVDDGHSDRGVADLLWFPTGGGKTEAYLGLIAFTIFYRRLRDGLDGQGVTVLMRYTLRLLTLQQFERASILICAMESMRRELMTQLGPTPVSIGMWVGRSSTPNTLERAEEQLQLRRRSRTSLPNSSENPMQLEKCSWCGEDLTVDDYQIQRQAKRMIIRCPNLDCMFSQGSGLPVHLIDEAVYDAHPSVVVATVDKFALMPWRAETSRLFNMDFDEDVKPPELIVQDELHLISGPLGTLTGLYETAIDELAERPKIVASTATIRRAADQIGALFDRRVRQFPPAGLDARDSWFAVEAPAVVKASRRYVGLLAPATSQATLMVRTYAALLHAVDRSHADESVKDAYWTLVGYFNSLRLLSAADLQVRDDVQGRLELLAGRDGQPKRRADAVIELSSRADSMAIPSYLKQLKYRLGHDDALDILLATNMMSVGVDINRLGLMAVMGQPQTTAEYIQATSRVGRQHPGLIAVMLNSARSRDRSHYEEFPGFHSALYRSVESTSVTPFSARARDRGLHAVIVALTRLMIPRAADNAAAGSVDDFVDEINSTIRQLILSRVEATSPAEATSTAEQFDDFVDWWQFAAETPGLVYEATPGSRRSLLGTYNEPDNPSRGWPTLWSLRDVDAESPLFLDNTRGER
ncbi:MAG: DNA helicase [Hamadaea sp.]|uniref:helicase-related protein n=1 Tax=Hamadaea sp. TaxID=2024425 RepID=UPI00179A40A1|nr:helicase-related protein [Hamadaea sp.]NUT19446.1 DNA helicase [Hamadaea sp.]